MLLLCVCCEKVASSKETAIKFLKCNKLVICLLIIDKISLHQFYFMWQDYCYCPLKNIVRCRNKFIIIV
jgi:hypothetical protein